MNYYRDYDGTWRIAGYEEFKFSTQADATPMEFA